MASARNAERYFRRHACLRRGTLTFVHRMVTVVVICRSKRRKAKNVFRQVPIKNCIWKEDWTRVSWNETTRTSIAYNMK